jgi:preprotein translocase subunit SecE
MSIIKSEDGKKWINAFIAAISLLICYIAIKFIYQLGEWFDLESKVKYFLAMGQVVGVLIGFFSFVFIAKSKNARKYLDEVYGELLKVVWPDKDSVIKLTVGIVIALTITSSFFVLVDYLFRQLLSLIY